ncbi:DUF2442 domain-containing protein [Candidatus Poribacteria bacterium]|nr:DUF2442 domain-containing protein [Candidatus Poribacteria bacterium]
MKNYHHISNIRFEGDFLLLSIGGEERKFRLKKISSTLEKASEKERNTFEISPSGYGIHWPLLDEDISIDGLLGIAHTLKWKKRLHNKSLRLTAGAGPRL